MTCYSHNVGARTVAIVEGENLLDFRPRVIKRSVRQSMSFVVQKGHFLEGKKIDQKTVGRELQKLDFVICVDKRGSRVQRSLNLYQHSLGDSSNQLCLLSFSKFPRSLPNGIDDALIKLIALHQIYTGKVNFHRISELGNERYLPPIPEPIPDNTLYVFSGDTGFNSLRDLTV